MSHIYKTIEVGSFKVEIVHDDDARHCNPRTDSDWNGSVLAIYERNVLTGDDLTKKPLPESRHALRDNFDDWDAFEQEIKCQYSPLIIRGVYGHDSNYHASEYSSEGFRNTSQIGVIFDAYEDGNHISDAAKELRERVGEYRKVMHGAMRDADQHGARDSSSDDGADDDETSEQQVSARAKQLDELCETYRKRLCAEIPKYDEAYRRLLESLDAQVEHYSDWARGNVYGYVVRDETGDTLESCWGFIGEPGESGVIYEGVDAAKALIEYEKKQTRLREQAMHL
jgi:hypothetical protein